MSHGHLQPVSITGPRSYHANSILIRGSYSVSSFSVPAPLAELNTAEDRMTFCRRLMMKGLLNPLQPLAAQQAAHQAEAGNEVEQVAVDVAQVSIGTSTEDLPQQPGPSRVAGTPASPRSPQTPGSSGNPGSSGTARITASDDDDSDFEREHEPTAGDYGELLDPTAPSTPMMTIRRQRRECSGHASNFHMAPTTIDLFGRSDEQS